MVEFYLVSEEGEAGPFSSIVTGEDHFLCDGVQYGFDVYGNYMVVQREVEPVVEEEPEPVPEPEPLPDPVNTAPSALVREGVKFGPFRKIRIMGDHYLCDSAVYPFSAVGEVVVEEWDDGHDRFESVRLSLLGQISVHKDKLLYENVEAQFPSGTKVIQFRNEVDQLVLTNVVQGAMVNCLNGSPGAEALFITEDNIVQVIEAQQMVQVGMAALTLKQGIVHTARAKKDYILGLEYSPENLETLLEYDVAQGW